MATKGHRARALAELGTTGEQIRRLRRQLERLEATADRRIVRALDAGATQDDCAALLGITRVRVSQRASAARAASSVIGTVDSPPTVPGASGAHVAAVSA